MCGICGVVALNQREDVGPQVSRLMAALAHRGPDGEGMRYVAGHHAALGHRRLSIVDLATGAQPMANEDETVWVSYNGEIYNHRALRSELERLGHRFRSQADTEVLVHGWEAWGPAVFSRLNGIFAIALFDGRGSPGEFVLARDPLGVKPLYLGGSGDRWWFASELGAVCQAGLTVGAVRAAAVEEFLVYRFIPSPGTPYTAAWKVPPGHYCRVPLGASIDPPHFQRYGSTFEPASVPARVEDWQEAIREGLRAAVGRQLMADVPIGSLLSGGVDSTIVTALMCDRMATPPQAFAIGFDAADADSELAMARAAAEALGVPLREVEAHADEYQQAWLSLVTGLGEPVANTGTLLVALLCRRVRETHKVVLSGQGADEPLGGYPRHTAERWYPLGRRFRRLFAAMPEDWAESDRVARMRRVMAEPDQGRRVAETIAVFSPLEVEQLTGQSCAERLVEPVQRWLRETDPADRVNALLFIDARLSLADDLLRVADHMSMASSVELRVPFLDLEFFALLERMPSRYKVAWTGARKWLYRRAVQGVLPVAVRSGLVGWRARTGRKLGFSTPLEQWVGQWASSAAEEFLTGHDAVLPQYVRVDRLRAVVSRARGRAAAGSRQLAALYVLEQWLRSAVDGRRTTDQASALAV